MGPAGGKAEGNDGALKRRVLHWAQSWPVFLIMTAWLMVFTWQHLLPEGWRHGAWLVGLPDARAGAAVPEVLQGAVVHAVD